MSTMNSIVISTDDREFGEISTSIRVSDGFNEASYVVSSDLDCYSYVEPEYESTDPRLHACLASLALLQQAIMSLPEQRDDHARDVMLADLFENIECQRVTMIDSIRRASDQARLQAIRDLEAAGRFADGTRNPYATGC